MAIIMMQRSHGGVSKWFGRIRNIILTFFGHETRRDNVSVTAKGGCAVTSPSNV